MSWGTWNYAHPVLCAGCEACRPLTPEQKLRMRDEARERVKVKRAIRRAFPGVDLRWPC